MARKKSVPDSVFENAERDYKNLKEGRVALKLMAIIAYKEHTSESISKIFKISQRHFQKLVKDYQELGLEGLIQHGRGHNASKLNKTELGEIKRWILESKTKAGKQIHWTLLKLKNEIKSVFGIDISTVAIWNHLHTINLVVKMPRPTHYKGDKEKQEEFKKNSTPPFRK